MAETANLEVEVKLGAAPGFHLPELDGVVTGVSAGKPEEMRLETTYYDTPDLRLARWGCSFRHRVGEGWTLKLPSTSDGMALSRPEHNYPGPPRKPPPEALFLVQAYLRRTPIDAVARLSTWRRRVQLKNAEGRLLGEVVDDEVSILDGRRVAARFRELEIEVKPEGRPLLDPLVTLLRTAGAGAPDKTAKHVRALGPRAIEAPEVSPASLPAQPTAGDVVRQAIAASVQVIFRHDPGVRLGDDPEHLHQARVATRRLRSDLRTFEILLDREWTTLLRSELAWLAEELGRVRDAEVLRDRLRERTMNLPAGDARVANGIIRRLADEVDRGRGKLMLALRSDRYFKLLDLLVEAARNPVFLEEEAARSAVEVLPELAAKPWKKLKQAVEQLTGNSPDADLHAARILAKRSRYAAELAARVVGKPAVRFARAVADLQTVLGEHQDGVNAQLWLRSLHSTGRQGFVAGELHALEHVATEAARQDWPRVWKTLKNSELRAWMG